MFQFVEALLALFGLFCLGCIVYEAWFDDFRDWCNDLTIAYWQIKEERQVREQAEMDQRLIDYAVIEAKARMSGEAAVHERSIRSAFLEQPDT